MANYQGVWKLNTQYQAIGSQNWPMQPSIPLNVTATAGVGQAIIAFTPPDFSGVPAVVTQYRVVSTPEGIVTVGTDSPIVVTGLTNLTSYSFSIQATNGVQFGEASTNANTIPVNASRGVYAGGNSNSNVIGTFQINSGGEDSSDFGDLAISSFAFYNASCSSSTRSIFIGGNSGSGTYHNRMEYVTIAGEGGSTDFGALKAVSTNQGNQFGSYFGAACSSATRGVILRAQAGASQEVVDITYITIAATGSDTDFGDLSRVAQYAGAVSSPTRGVFMVNQGNLDMEYVTIASTGNSVTFGGIGTYSTGGPSGAGDSTRGLFVTGGSNSIRYLTFATTGSAEDFGNLTTVSQGQAFMSDSVYAVRAGGYNGTIHTNTMDRVTISTLGDAVDFGDITEDNYGFSGSSDSHGGL